MAREAGFALEEAQGWKKPAYSGLYVPDHTWRLRNVDIAPDQPLPDGVDAQYELASILQVPPANIVGIYPCNEAAGNLVSLVAGAPALVPSGTPLYSRSCNGLNYKGRLTAKRGIEFPTFGHYFMRAAGASGFANPNNSRVSILVVYRVLPSITAANWRLVAHETGGVQSYAIMANNARVAALINGAPPAGGLVVATADEAWHCAILVVDDVALTTQVFSDMGNSNLDSYAGSGSRSDVNARFSIGDSAGSSSSQVAYVAVLDIALDATHLGRFWRHGTKSASVSTYSRAAVVRAAVRSGTMAGGIVDHGAVAAWGANQVVAVHSPSFNPRRNWRAVGDYNERAFTFVGIGSATMASMNDNGGNTHSSVDGPSGCRDAVRVNQAAAWAPFGLGSNYSYLNNPLGATLAGATAVPFTFGCWARPITGTTLRVGLLLNGPSGWDQLEVIVNNAAPRRWAFYTGQVTPVFNDHTTVYACFGCQNAGEVSEYAEAFLCQNETQVPLVWDLTAGVNKTIGVTTETVVNSVEHYYNAMGGRIVWRGVLQAAAAAPTQRDLFYTTAVPGIAGYFNVYVDNANRPSVLAYDALGVAAFSMNGDAVAAGYHEIELEWNAALPVYWSTGVDYHAVLRVDGAMMRVAATGAWTPPSPQLTSPLCVGHETGPANVARSPTDELVLKPITRAYTMDLGDALVAEIVIT